jgi:hypothetical protein
MQIRLPQWIRSPSSPVFRETADRATIRRPRQARANRSQLQPAISVAALYLIAGAANATLLY